MHTYLYCFPLSLSHCRNISHHCATTLTKYISRSVMPNRSTLLRQLKLVKRNLSIACQFNEYTCVKCVIVTCHHFRFPQTNSIGLSRCNWMPYSLLFSVGLFVSILRWLSNFTHYVHLSLLFIVC